MAALFDWFLHLDTHLAAFAASHGMLVYGVLFAVILVETGVVVLPFLPGDSLLFVAGAMAAQGTFSLALLLPLLMAAAVAGDALNFAAGSFTRRRAIDTQKIPLLKGEHLARTRSFFDRHGKKTIVLARFVPVVRTLAAFVAALGNMAYPTFFKFNVIGAVCWVALLVGAGYLFGNVAWIASHLTIVLLGIVGLSILPGLIGWFKQRV